MSRVFKVAKRTLENKFCDLVSFLKRESEDDNSLTRCAEGVTFGKCTSVIFIIEEERIILQAVLCT